MKQYFINLFEYETRSNKAVSDCLISLSEPPEKALSLMSHIINAQEIWLCRLMGKAIDVNSVWKTIPGSEITAALKSSSAALRDYISGLSEIDIERIFEYKNIKGEEFKSSLKDILTHLSFHSAYHRGQIILLIKPFVNELPSTDYIKYVRDNELMKPS